MISRMIKRELIFFLLSFFLIFLITSISVVLIEGIEKSSDPILKGFLRSMYFMVIIYIVFSSNSIKSAAIKSIKKTLLKNGLRRLRVVILTVNIIFFILTSIFFYFSPLFSLKFVIVMFFASMQNAYILLILYYNAMKIIKKEKNYKVLLSKVN